MRARSILAFLFLCLSQPSPASPLGFLDRLLPRDKSGDTASSSQPSGGQKIPPPEIYFSPKGGCTEAVVRELANARQTILVQAYSFTSTSIAAALVAASRRGVRVEAVLDKSNKTGKYSAADFLVNARIPTWIDSSHAIAHNKVMVIDNSTVITGSFNFTKAAEESNAENLLILRAPQLASRYTASFLEHREHSVPHNSR
jgi:phosphatidylserine/phosphatidylglycerophosphate/cardiolipin synthase-like enzyme